MTTNPQDQKAIDSAERRAHECNSACTKCEDTGLVKSTSGRMCHCIECNKPEMGQPFSSIKWTKSISTKKCPTCCQPVGKPYRSRLIGVPGNPTAQGCVDQCHGPHLKPGSPDHRWHFHPKAERIRLMLKMGVPR